MNSFAVALALRLLFGLVFLAGFSWDSDSSEIYVMGQDNDGFYLLNSIIGSNDLQEVTSIDIAPMCSGKPAPKTMFTIAPADRVVVWSYPKDLVSVFVDDGERLRIEWSSDATNTNSLGAGVKIGIPKYQLERVRVGSGSNVQIVDGFVHIRDFEVDGNSNLWAVMQQLTDGQTSINLSVDGNSVVNVDSTGPLGNVRVVRTSTAKLKVPTIQNVDINENSKVFVEGNAYGGEISGRSTLMVTNTVYGGYLENKGGSTVYIGGVGCEMSVSTDDPTSTCITGAKADDFITQVDVSFDYQPWTLSGDDICSYDESSDSSRAIGFELVKSVAIAIVLTCWTQWNVVYSE